MIVSFSHACTIHVCVCVCMCVCVLCVCVYILKNKMVTQFSILSWRIPWTVSLAGYSPWGHKESDTTEVTQHTRKQLIGDYKCHYK